MGNISIYMQLGQRADKMKLADIMFFGWELHAFYIVQRKPLFLDLFRHTNLILENALG